MLVTSGVEGHECFCSLWGGQRIEGSRQLAEMKNPWEDWFPCCLEWDSLMSYVICKYVHHVSLTRILTSWCFLGASVEALSKLEILSWRAEQFGPWEGGTEWWGSLQSAVVSVSYLCFGLHDLLLSQARWLGKQQCTAKSYSLLANPAPSGDRVIHCIASCSCTGFLLPSFFTRGRAEDRCVNMVCFEMLKVSLGFFCHCSESSFFWEYLSVFASFGSQSLASVYAQKERCWFLFQRA